MLAGRSIHTDSLKLFRGREILINNLQENIEALHMDTGAHQNRGNITMLYIFP